MKKSSKNFQFLLQDRDECAIIWHRLEKGKEQRKKVKNQMETNIVVKREDEVPEWYDGLPMEKRLAYKNIRMCFWWLIGNFESGLKDARKTLQEYESGVAMPKQKYWQAKDSVHYLERMLKNHKELVTLTWIGARSEVFANGERISEKRERELTDIIKAIDKEWVKEEAERRVTSEGY